MGAKSVDASEVLKSLQGLIQSSPLVRELALREAAKVVRKRSRAIVPVDKGLLKKGIKYTVGPDGAKITASSRDGGAEGEYALIVHESTEMPHKNGQPKFIEKVVIESASDGTVQKALVDAVRERFRQRFGFHLPPDTESED